MTPEDSDRTEIRSSRSREPQPPIAEPVRTDPERSGISHSTSSAATSSDASLSPEIPPLPPLPEPRRAVNAAAGGDADGDRSRGVEMPVSGTLRLAALGGSGVGNGNGNGSGTAERLLPSSLPAGMSQGGEPAEVRSPAPAESLLNAEPGVITLRIRELFQRGDTVEQFTILRRIGGGGMGQIFCARDTLLDRDVALKVLAVDPMTEDALRRFHQEARSAARLNHRNIALVWQSGVHGGIPYIVFEYVQGENIRHIVERKHGDGSEPMPMDVALGYAVQVTSALIHAWRRDVVHRDIKPSNILVTPDGCVKLIDLGLARVERGPADTDLTQSGMTLGTFDYLAPEQAEDARQADCRSDIYSLGCTLFFMFTGRPPFEGTTIQKLIDHRDSEPPDVRKLRPDLPEDVARLLRRMMAKSPSARYQNPEDLLAALQVLVDEHHLRLEIPVDQFAASRDIPWKRMLERHLPWLVPTLLVIATAVIFRQLDRTPTMMPTPTESGPVSPGAASGTLSSGTGQSPTASSPAPILTTRDIPSPPIPVPNLEMPPFPGPGFLPKRPTLEMSPPPSVETATATGTTAGVGAAATTGRSPGGVSSDEPGGPGKAAGNGTGENGGFGGSMFPIQPAFPPDRNSPSPDGYGADEAHAVPVSPTRVPWNTGS